MNPIFVTWAKAPEIVGGCESGGCESIFKDLANNLNGMLLTYPFGNTLFTVPGMPTNFKYVEEFKSWILDDVLKKMLKDEKRPVVANCGTINIWKKHKTKIINIFNDPYRLAQETMIKNGSCEIYFPHVVKKLVELQKKSAKGAFNIAVSKIAKKAMEKEGIKCKMIIEHGVDDKFFKPLNKEKLRKKYGISNDAKVGVFVGLVRRYNMDIGF